MIRTLGISLLVLMATAVSAALQDYQFISPKPGSDFNTRESTIIIRYGDRIDPASLADRAPIRVLGSEGVLAGRIILSTDGRTVIFEPAQLFNPGADITVEISAEIKTSAGDPVPPAVFSFKVAPFKETPNPYAYIEDLRPVKPITSDLFLSKAASDTVPVDFPAMSVEINDTAAIGDGYVYQAVAAEVEGIGYYLMVLDNLARPVWYRKLAHDYAYDFKVQPNGQMTYGQFIEHHSYTGGGDVIHMIMDKNFNLVDSVQMKNGYVAEGHDFQILPNGHKLMFGYYLTQVDLSPYVNGGYPDALVSGGVIQEHDANGNVIFQWRSWDYYDFAEYPWGRRSNQPIVSAFHLNTINLDTDGNLFIATPEWVKKINRQTGDIMWHLGGDENEFSFVGVDSLDGVGHFGGHGFHRLPNGNVLIYDNGNRQGTRSSQVHEYALDEENRIATHVWTYVPDTPVYAWHRGNAQRLPNGNTVIGWGGASGKPGPAFTEVDPAGEVVMEISFDNPDVESYRAYRFPMPGNVAPVSVTEYELAAGNTYEFSQGDSIDTGISLKINSQTGDGYNEVTVERWPLAPLYPKFPGKSPRVEPVRVEISDVGITTINADISFDAVSFGLANPDTMIIYHREFSGQGLFIPLATSYNPVTKKLTATTTKLGEFILALPDIEEAAYAPILGYPAEADTLINQELPVRFSWTPRGLFTGSHIQVATDGNFDNLVVNDSLLAEEYHIFEGLEAETRYYWRVRTRNEAGISGWSDAWFETAAPVIGVDTPDGGETWQRGLAYFVRWTDNIDEDVVLELHKAGEMVGILDTAASTGAYKWEIDPALEPGADYRIRIVSVTVDTLFDQSTEVFSVIDTTTSVDGLGDRIPSAYQLRQNYPNPFNPATQIQYALPVAGHVMVDVYNPLGQKITTLVNAYKTAGIHTVAFSGQDLPSGIYLYRIQANGFFDVKKMILIK